MKELLEMGLNMIAMNYRTTILGLALYAVSVFILKSTTPKRMKIKELLLFSLPYLNIVLVLVGVIGIYTNLGKLIVVAKRPIYPMKKLYKQTKLNCKKLTRKVSMLLNTLH